MKSRVQLTTKSLIKGERREEKRRERGNGQMEEVRKRKKEEGIPAADREARVQVSLARRDH